MVESAKSVELFFSMFISPHNGTGIHTDAMMMATQTKEGECVHGKGEISSGISNRREFEWVSCDTWRSRNILF